MDGDLNPQLAVNTRTADPLAREAALPPRRDTTRRPKTLRWLVIVGLLLAIVLGGLYGFNCYREKAIATFFASNKPPPAQISAVTATTEAVPRSYAGIGSLAAVHQVTVTPEIGGAITAIRFEPGAVVKAGDPLVQLNDGPERGDLANYEAQARWAAASLERAKALAQRQVGPEQNVDQWQSQLDQARGQILKTQAVIAQKLIRAPFSGRSGCGRSKSGNSSVPAPRSSP